MLRVTGTFGITRPQFVSARKWCIRRATMRRECIRNTTLLRPSKVRLFCAPPFLIFIAHDHAPMHAEVFVRFAEDLRFDLLTAGLPSGSDPAQVLADMSVQSIADVLATAIYSRVDTSFGYIVFKEDGRSIRVHVEGRVDKDNLRDLVQRSERVAERFISLGRTHGRRLDCAEITLYAGSAIITMGRYRTWRQRLMKRFAETIFGDVMVGLFTCVLTGVLTGQWVAGAVVGMASVLCFLMWLTIQIQGERDEFEFGRL